MNRKNPYQRLLERIQKFCFDLQYPHTRTMFFFPKEKLSIGWDLKDVYERTAAAGQLGYDVILEHRENGLFINYRKKMPVIPYDWQDKGGSE